MADARHRGDKIWILTLSMLELDLVRERTRVLSNLFFVKSQFLIYMIVAFV